MKTTNSARDARAAIADDRGKLVKLGDTNLTVSDQREDIRGRRVVDRAGGEIGDVDALMIDERERKVRFIQVASGGFLGIGERTFLLPVDAVRGVGGDAVQVDQTRERMIGSPAYDPDLTYERDYYGDVAGYYGYAPYWTPGYAYPAYPT